MLGIFCSSIFEVGGGMVAAAVLSWLAWSMFKLVRYPELGVPAASAAILVVAGGVPHSPLVQMTLLFMVLTGLVVWSEGAAWRRRVRLAHMFKDPPPTLLACHRRQHRLRARTVTPPAQDPRS